MKRLLLFLAVLFIAQIGSAQIAPITGIGTVCVGSTTILSESSGGGTWTSAAPGIAAIGSSSGIVTGVSAGTALITYSVLVYRATTVVTVNPLPSAITGPSTVCQGFSVTESETATGGLWSSVPTTVAVIGSTTGVVTGLTSGGATINYTLPTGCTISTAITVNPNPAAIVSYSPWVYTGTTVLESDATPGGTWVSGNTTIATINTGGVASGVAEGMAYIYYILPTGCFTSIPVRVNPLPDSGVSGISPLFAWYPFCSDTADHGPLGNTLMAHNLTTFIPTLTNDRFGVPGDAFHFNGINNLLYFSTYFTTPGDFTYSCWMNPNGIAQNAIIMYNGKSSSDGYGFVMNNGAPFTTGGTAGNFVSVLFGNVGTFFPYDLSSLVGGMTRWTNLTLEKSGNTYIFTVRAYPLLNVVFTASTSVFAPLPPSQNFSVGSDFNLHSPTLMPNTLFNGDIDDIAVYLRLLSPREKANLYGFNPDIYPFTLGPDTTICSDYLSLAPRPQEIVDFYKWYNGDTADTVITVKPTIATLGNKYWITLSKYQGCAVTDTIIVFKHPIPIDLGNDIDSCVGSTVTLLGNAASFPGSNFTWNTGSTAHSLTVSSSGKYWVVLDSSVCIGRDTINVRLHAIPNANLGPDVSKCQGQPDTLKPQADPGFTYTWSDLSTADTLLVNTSGKFWVTVNDSGCVRSDTINLNIVYDTMTFYFKDTAICKGASIQPKLTTNIVSTYQWRPTTGIPVATIAQPNITPDTSATYVLTVSSHLCPDVVDSFKVDVQPNPVVFAGSKIRSVCQFDTLHLVATVAPSWYTHYVYSWTPGTYLDDTFTRNIVFTAGDSTNLVLTVTTPAGCWGKDSTEIITHPGNFDSLYITSPNVCPGDSVQLITGFDTVASQVAVTATYKWTPATYLSSDTAQSPWVKPITSLSYQVIATSQWGCRDTLNVGVTVESGAVIDIPDSATIYPGESYRITPQTNCAYFRWFPSLGLVNEGDSVTSNPVVAPTVNTRYFVRAWTEQGCRVVDSIYISYQPETVIDIPNAFTPGSGINSVFKPVKRGIAKLNYFRIYDRWGIKVFESTNIDAGWDGTFQGKQQPFAVYVYEIEAETSTGVIFHKAGNVTLLR